MGPVGRIRSNPKYDNVRRSGCTVVACVCEIGLLALIFAFLLLLLLLLLRHVFDASGTTNITRATWRTSSASSMRETTVERNCVCVFAVSRDDATGSSTNSTRSSVSNACSTSACVVMRKTVARTVCGAFSTREANGDVGKHDASSAEQWWVRRRAKKSADADEAADDDDDEAEVELKEEEEVSEERGRRKEHRVEVEIEVEIEEGAENGLLIEIGGPVLVKVERKGALKIPSDFGTQAIVAVLTARAREAEYVADGSRSIRDGSVERRSWGREMMRRTSSGSSRSSSSSSSSSSNSNGNSNGNGNTNNNNNGNTNGISNANANANANGNGIANGNSSDAALNGHGTASGGASVAIVSEYGEALREAVVEAMSCVVGCYSSSGRMKELVPYIEFILSVIYRATSDVQSILLSRSANSRPDRLFADAAGILGDLAQSLGSTVSIVLRQEWVEKFFFSVSSNCSNDVRTTVQWARSQIAALPAVPMPDTGVAAGKQ